MIDREAMIRELMQLRKIDRTSAQRIADFQIGEMDDLKGVTPDDPEEIVRSLTPPTPPI